MLLIIEPIYYNNKCKYEKVTFIPGRSVTLLVVEYVRKKSSVAVGRISLALRAYKSIGIAI